MDLKKKGRPVAYRMRNSGNETDRRSVVNRIALEHFSEEVGMGGFDVTAVEETIETLSSIPQMKRKKNLYYIVMPSGVGKTYYANKYNLIDVDCCVPSSKRVFLGSCLDMLSRGKNGLNSNDDAMLWVKTVRSTFKNMHFSKPEVVLVHDSLTGYLIGGTKLGSVNLSLETKLSMVTSKERRGLIMLNDTVHNLSASEDGCMSCVEEVEKWLISKCRRINIELEEDISHSDGHLIAMYNQGDISDRAMYRAFRLKADHKGFGYGVNDWCMAMAASTGKRTKPERYNHMTVNDFKRNFEYEGHSEVMKILISDHIEEWDKVLRIMWWETRGVKSSSGDMLLEMITNVPTIRMLSVMERVGVYVARSRIVLGIQIDDETRMAMLELSKAYGAQPPTMKMFETDLHQSDLASRMVRLNTSERCRSAVITKQVAAIVSEVYGIDTSDRKLTTITTKLNGWSGKQAVALLAVCSQNIMLSNDINSKHLTRVVLDDMTDMMSSIEKSMHSRLKDYLNKSAVACTGLIGVVAEKGISYLVNETEVDEKMEYAQFMMMVLGKCTVADGDSAIEERIVMMSKRE